MEKPQLDALTLANREFADTHRGESGRRQPVHTFYGGAHLFTADGARKLGALAEKSLIDYAPDAATFALATGIAPKFAETIYDRVLHKLRREPIEDIRLDFEDGYGNRTDEEEDATCDSAAAEVAKGLKESTLPPFIGIRIKPLNEEMKRRSLRTLTEHVYSPLRPVMKGEHQLFELSFSLPLPLPLPPKLRFTRGSLSV